MSTQPRTAAGRRIQRELEYLSLASAESIAANICAIEDEAVRIGLDVDALRAAARHVGMPREVTVADIENLAAEYGRQIEEQFDPPATAASMR